MSRYNVFLKLFSFIALKLLHPYIPVQNERFGSFSTYYFIVHIFIDISFPHWKFILFVLSLCENYSKHLVTLAFLSIFSRSTSSALVLILVHWKNRSTHCIQVIYAFKVASWFSPLLLAFVQIRFSIIIDNGKFQ